MTAWRMVTFIIFALVAVWLVMLLSGCASSDGAKRNTPRALQLAPICIVGCTVIHEQALGGNLGAVTVSQERRVRR